MDTKLRFNKTPGFTEYRGSDVTGGAPTNTSGFFREAHVNRTFGNNGNWEAPSGLELAQNNGSSSVLELFVPWEKS